MMSEIRVGHIKKKIETIRAKMRRLEELAEAVKQAPDGQISLTDPDARCMATSGKGTAMVGYNVQTAVDTRHHMIVAHEVTDQGHDRNQLASMARKARDVLRTKELTVLADRGYFSGEENRKCDRRGITALVAKTLTSNNRARIRSRCRTRWPSSAPPPASAMRASTIG